MPGKRLAAVLLLAPIQLGWIFSPYPVPGRRSLRGRETATGRVGNRAACRGSNIRTAWDYGTSLGRPGPARRLKEI